jgi:orotate phosphoribosyltransferase
MTPEEVTAIYERSGALLSGHFQLTSGLHAERYLQSALALRDPANAEQLGSAVAEKFAGQSATLVVGPALGAMILAYEVARALRVPMVFTERDPDTRKMTLRRGFVVAPTDRVVVVEDVVTTGGSVAEAGAIVTAAGAKILGYGCIADRTTGRKVPWSEPFVSLMTMELRTWKPAECPLCEAGDKAVKPGSRPKGGA